MHALFADYDTYWIRIDWVVEKRLLANKKWE